jgi:hypothetical protein
LHAGGTHQDPGGFDGGVGGEHQDPGGFDGGDGNGNSNSSSVSQMSAQRSEASPACEPELTGDELPSSVLLGLPKSVDVKLLKLEEQIAKSVYAR